MSVQKQIEAADGTLLRYRVDGGAARGAEAPPTLLLQHGLGFRAEAWDGWLPALLAAGYRVIRPDWRGHGASGPMPAGGRWSTDGLVDDVEAVLAAEGVGACHLVGESWGGAMMLALAARLGSRARSVTTLSTPFDGRRVTAARGFAEEIRERGLAAWSAGVAANRANGQPALLAWADRAQCACDADSLIGICAYIVGETIEPRLAAVTAPALVMAPLGSHFVNPALARELADRLTLSEIAWFPDHNHGLVLSGGALAAATLLNFIARREEATT